MWQGSGFSHASTARSVSLYMLSVSVQSRGMKTARVGSPQRTHGSYFFDTVKLKACLP